MRFKIHVERRQHSSCPLLRGRILLAQRQREIKQLADAVVEQNSNCARAIAPTLVRAPLVLPMFLRSQAKQSAIAVRNAFYHRVDPAPLRFPTMLFAQNFSGTLAVLVIVCWSGLEPPPRLRFLCIP